MIQRLCKNKNIVDCESIELCLQRLTMQRLVHGISGRTSVDSRLYLRLSKASHCLPSFTILDNFLPMPEPVSILAHMLPLHWPFQFAHPNEPVYLFILFAMLFCSFACVHLLIFSYLLILSVDGIFFFWSTFLFLRISTFNDVRHEKKNCVSFMV